MYFLIAFRWGVIKMTNKEAETYKIVLEYLKNNSPCTISEILLEVLKGKILDSPKKDIRNCLINLRKNGLVISEFEKETKTRYFSAIEKK
jgi:hypothetical protein